MRTILLALALLWALPVSAQDTIRSPATVVTGGITHAVVVDGDTVSTHATDHRAETMARVWYALCQRAGRSCEIRINTQIERRIEAQAFYVDRPDAWAPDEPQPSWSVDSTTVYPAGVEPTDSLRVTDLHWREGLSHSCVTIAGDAGYAEVRTQEVDGVPYWVVVPADPGWWPTDCTPSMATLPEYPTEDWPAYRVGILTDAPPQPIPASPVVEYANSTLTVTWEPSPSDWVSHYSVTYGANDGSGTTGAWTSGTEYQTATEIMDGWFCVRAVRGGEMSEQRCNSWSTGGP